jgi:pimeloyl-ACP methyl ester carboxylesterase
MLADDDMDPIATPPDDAPARHATVTREGRLTRADGATIAYAASAGKGPGVVFLGGFMSDMTGTKATMLEAFCRSRGQAFVRFDYFAHGASSGDFADATIGRWREDALAVLDNVTAGPQILVGSSIGGWLMLLAALARPERVAGLVGIAAAPDATEDLMEPELSAEQRATMLREGQVRIQSAYDPNGYLITRRLIEEGRQHLVLRAPIPLTCSVRLLHGMADPDVPWQTSLRLAQRLEGRDVTVTLIAGGDHRLSTESDLAKLRATVAEVSALVGFADGGRSGNAAPSGDGD